jgi:hypothetical protein
VESPPRTCGPRWCLRPARTCFSAVLGKDVAMSRKQPAGEQNSTTVVANDPEDLRGRLKSIGGSQSDPWNNMLANQAIGTLWAAQDAEARSRQCTATVGALVGIEPKDEIEGMIAAQLIAAHCAAMECYRRAMVSEQTFEARHENLRQATKLSRASAALIETPNRHRGKGQQKVTVEHVHVHSGGQAIVGTVERSTPVSPTKSEDHNERQVTHAPQPPLWSRTRSGNSCQAPAMPNGRCRMHGGHLRERRREIRTRGNMAATPQKRSHDVGRFQA